MGIKKDSYLKFKALNSRIANKEHLDPILRQEMINEAHAINSSRKFKLPSSQNRPSLPYKGLKAGTITDHLVYNPFRSFNDRGGLVPPGI